MSEVPKGIHSHFSRHLSETPEGTSEGMTEGPERMPEGAKVMPETMPGGMPEVPEVPDFFLHFFQYAC